MNNELKITVSTNVRQANENLKHLQQTLQGTGNVISRVGKIFDKEGNLISKTIASTEQKGNHLYRTIQRLDGNGTLRNLSQSVTEVKSQTDKASKSMLGFKNVMNLGIAIAGVRALSKGLLDVTTKAIDYSESLNLFNVAFNNIEKDGQTVFSEVGKKADEFQRKLQGNFGANRTESMYYQAIYQAMAESQGIADKYANIMSENATKLTYDLSSLFNKSQDQTANALRSGIFAGETEPLRNYGIDLTEKTLQSTLNKMKETNSALQDLQVTTMGQAEKQILRYLTALEQSSNAHGDFANTINSPANQLKILQNQIIETGVAIGNLFVGPLQKLLTFANTVIIVVKQVAQAIGSLFGIKIKDYNTGIASASGYADTLADSYGGVGNSAGKASKKIKELNRQALAFDNINNINENKGNSGGGGTGSGGGAGTGINQALLDALKGYDNGLDKVRLKAQKIADQIMKWLGFTYDAEEGVWKLGRAYDNLIASCKNLGKAFDVLGKYTFENLQNFYKNFLKPVGSWTLGIGLPKFVDITANGIMKTDWANLNDKLNNFYKALAPFSINVGEGLLWFYEKVLVPVGSFTIGKVVPEFLQLLASGITILNNTINTAKPFVNFLWDNFLSPIAKWTGGVAVSVLKDINSIFGLIAKSKVASTVTTLGTAFLLIKSNGGAAKTAMSLLSKVFGGLSKDAKTVGDNLSDSKQTGLVKIISKLKTIISSALNPVGKLATSIKNASKESGDFAKKTKESGSILDLFKAKTNNANTAIKNMASKLKGTRIDIKDFTTQLKNGIQTWQNTTTGADKLKTALIGISGTVASLQGVSVAMKDIAENGLNMGNSLSAGASALSSIASGMTTGASIGGVYGAVIGGVVGAVGSLVMAMQGYSSVSNEARIITDTISASYDNYKTKMDEINSSYYSAIETAQKNAEVKLAEVENTKMLSSSLEEMIDINGRVKSGYEEKANVIMTQLNEALGTELTLEDGVISNNGKIISSKQEFIDLVLQSAEAIQKETLMQLYQSEYKTAIERQVEAKRTYNKVEEETIALINKTIEALENQEITADGASDIMREAKDKISKAESKYQTILGETNSIIGGLEKVTSIYANGSSKDLKKAIEDVSKTNKKTNKDTTDSFDTSLKKLDGAIKTVRKNSSELQRDIDNIKNKNSGSKINMKLTLETKDFRRDWNKVQSEINNAVGKQVMRSIAIKGYANGGFPEDGFFYANHNELVGQFSNGKTAVANNEQITAGIERAVTNAMSRVMATYGGSSNVNINVHTDESTIVETAVNGINRIVDTTGECPIRVM